MQFKTSQLSAGVQKEISARVQKETASQGVFSEDFRPDVEGWRRGLGDGPELSERVMDQSDCGSFGGRDVPALAKKVDLVVGIDPSFEVERQVEVQKCGRRTGAGGGALFRQGFFPAGIGAAAGGAANGGILALNLAVEHDLCGGIAADFFIGQDGDQAFLQGAKAAFDLAFGLRARSDQMGYPQSREGALEL